MRECPVPTMIVTEGWTAAGHRLRGMVRRQLLALGETGDVDVSGSDDSDRVGPVPEGAVVYGFGRGGPAPAPGAGRPAWFWSAGPGGAGEGGAPAPDPEARIVVPSHWARAGAIAAGARADCVSVVAPGIDGAAFAPLSRRDRDAVRANLGLGAEETALLHIGDGGAQTGIDLALRAFARLQASGARVRLILATEDPDTPVDYDRIVRAAAADEPALREAACLAAVTTLQGPLGPADWRMLYGVADLLVAPDRGCAFPFPVLEALACGCPVVTTRGGAADDIGGDDLAWRISGRVERDAEGGLSIAPDLDELADALAEVAQGRGFDRLRFAAARMRLLREATWERSARRLAAALGIDGPRDRAGPARPAVLHGLPQPVSDRFAATPSRDLASARRRATRRMICPGPAELSVVVQGPCLRVPAEPGAPSIDEAIASIRRSFPGAQVIVSTWLGSDIAGLDADDIVLSPDPGSLQHPMHLPNNVNRMTTSTANGLAAATRPFCIKTRNDVLFVSDDLIRHDLNNAAEHLSLERRIWSSGARLDTSLRPFHPCDMIQYGLTEDLRRLWDTPSWSETDVFLPDPFGHVPLLAPEQALFIGYLRRIGFDPQLQHTFDGRPEIISGSIHHMLGAFDAHDHQADGVILSERFRSHPLRPNIVETRANFEQLRSDFVQDPDATCAAMHRACQATLGQLVGKPAEASV